QSVGDAEPAAAERPRSERGCGAGIAPTVAAGLDLGRQLGLFGLALGRDQRFAAVIAASSRRRVFQLHRRVPYR
ncbi:MAG TPA: hypothetical protein VE993_18600, partial [Stellaceae bacterium]|nr:hypothetical protein [Stellaceae bacterium]